MEALAYKTELIQDFKTAKLYRVSDESAVVLEATKNYITIDEFKDIFSKITEYVKSNRIEKLIFDKRNLTVFHQPSMEWYYTEWKNEMAKSGLTKHRKILPNDDVFKHSVKIGKASLADKYPDAAFHNLDIQYCDSIEECIEK